MRRHLLGPAWALTVLMAFPATAGASQSTGVSTLVEPEAPAEDDDAVVVIEDEMEGESAPSGPVSDGEGSGDIDDLLGDDDSKKKAAATEEEAPEKDSEAKQIKTETKLISVVQRQRMLKARRVEIQPQFGISINDPYVRHYTLGADINYWLTNRIALGVTGTGFIAAKTPRYKNIRIQEGILLTANKVLWQASLNFTVNPFYGKIAIFNRALLHWEGSFSFGGGPMQTQVIPRYPPLHDPFRTFTGGGHFGLNGRFYTRRIDWLSVNAGVRTWVYADKLEPSNRGPNDAPGSSGAADDPDLNDAANAKKAADFKAAFNVVFYLGVSFYVPTSFKYTTPR